jgi:hypothetical protein
MKGKWIRCRKPVIVSGAGKAQDSDLHCRQQGSLRRNNLRQERTRIDGAWQMCRRGQDCEARGRLLL